LFNKYVRNLLVWALILVVVLYLVLPLYHQRAPREEISYSEFIDKARSGQVAQVTVSEESVSGQLKDGRSFRTYIPSGDASYIDLLQSKGVTITVEPRSRSSMWTAKQLSRPPERYPRRIHLCAMSAMHRRSENCARRLSGSWVRPGCW